MSSSKPSGTATTVVSNDPWEGQSPYLEQGFKDAEILKNNPMQFYPNSTVVPFHRATQDALSGTESRARAGSDLLRAGQTQVGATAGGAFQGANPGQFGFGQFGAGQAAPQAEMSKTASGGYMGSNPYLKQVVDLATQQAGAGVDARFNQAGRYGSGHHAKSIADTGANIASQVYGQEYGQERARQQAAANSLAQTQLSGLRGTSNAYEGERARQMQAAAMTPTMASADYGDLTKLGQVGSAYEGQGRAELQDQINRYIHAQQAPRDALKEYMASIGGGSYGGSSTQQQPIYSNPFGEALGMGASAAGIAGSLWGQNGAFPNFWG